MSETTALLKDLKDQSSIRSNSTELSWSGDYDPVSKRRGSNPKIKSSINSKREKPEMKYDEDVEVNEPEDDEESVPDYIPTSYKSDMNCYRGDSAFCLFVWVAIPILFFMDTLLPMDFSLFLPANIAALEEDGVKSYELRVMY